MNKEEIDDYESPYCDVCGHCGEIGCCGIRNFISEHIEGKTNCKNEGWIINDLINLCDYKDEVFEKNKHLQQENKQLKKRINEAIEYIEEQTNRYEHDINDNNLIEGTWLYDLVKVLAILKGNVMKKRINYEEQAKKFANLLVSMCFEHDYEEITDNEDWYRLKACNYDGWQEVFCRWLYKFGYIEYDREKREYRRFDGDDKNE